jgi:ubiquinol-cytochrome c reductase iron-sulfur subunit
MLNEIASKVLSVPVPSSASLKDRKDLPPKIYVMRRRLLIATGGLGGCGVVASAIPFLASMEPSERARALGAPVEVDLGSLQPGQLRTESWRGRPVWILRRTPEMLSTIEHDASLLADPLSAHSIQPKNCTNQFRSIKPELAVMIGVCTHLGCTPTFRPQPADPVLGVNWPGGFYCPCHGSRFDLAGRVFKDVPAPTNLEIPSYRYLSDRVVRIGDEKA